MLNRDGVKISTSLHDLKKVINLINGPACLLDADNTILHSNVDFANLGQDAGAGAPAARATEPVPRLRLEPTVAVRGEHQGAAAGEITLAAADGYELVEVGNYRICKLSADTVVDRHGQADVYRSVVEKQSELICRIDLNGRITFANTALCNFLGKDEIELYELKLQDLVDKDCAKAIADSLASPPDMLSNSLLELNITQDADAARCTRWSVSPVEGKSGVLLELQLTGRDITNQKVYYEELLKYQQQLRNLTGRIIMTEEVERRRIAQGLNDDIGNRLAAACEVLRTSAKADDHGHFKQATNECLELISKAHESARTLTFELSPPILFEVGFVAALEWLAGQILSRHGVKVEFNDDGKLKSVSDEVLVLLYHSVRELLINVVNHAEATKAEVTLSADSNNTVVVVQDNGKGFDPCKLERANNEYSGYGHFTISERISQLGGSVDIISSPGKGTKVTITTPRVSPSKSKGSDLGTRRHPGRRKTPERTGVANVMLVDDNNLMRSGLKLLLDDCEGISVIAEATDSASALDLAGQFKPDVVVMDINMPNLESFALIRNIIEKLPQTRVIALSLHHDKNNIKNAFQAGVVAYLLKDDVHDDLVHTIRTASPSLRFVSDKVFNRMFAYFTSYIESSASERLNVLSNREREVLGYIADGMTTKTIALRLNLSAKTVETYRRRITDKLHLDSVAELTKFALQEGLTSMPV